MKEEIISYTRRNCRYDGCKRKGRNKGFYKGKIRYDIYCEIHHRLRYGGIATFEALFRKQHIDNSSCELCGWDKAPCDRHRIKPELGYTKENVKVLCPNCHRLEEMEKTKLWTQ